MKTRVIVLGMCLLVGNAWGITDPTPDLLGVYFDQQGDNYCLEFVQPWDPFDLYAVVTNPTVDQIIGFEFGMETPMWALLSSVQTPCNPFWDPIENVPYVVGCGSPVALAEATVLVHFQFMLDSFQLESLHFYVTGAEYPSSPSGQPGLLLPGGEFLPLQVRGGTEEPTAYVNVNCAVGTEALSWDAIKATYR